MIETLSSLSTEKKIGQLFVIGISGPELDAETSQLLADISPGGVCLFARNIKEAEQTRNLTDEIRLRLPTVPILSIDQEGGLVDRLRRLVTPMPAAGKIKTASDAAQLAAIIAESLLILGFNLDFAPVVDVSDQSRETASNGLYSRSFGNCKEQASEFSQAFLSALQKNGITGSLKHFPGLGAARVDSHEELPLVEITEAEFNDIDLYPYRELLSGNSIQMVMAAHAAYPHHRLQEKDQNGKLLPSSLSFNFITRLLRDELGFDGVVISDDLEMGAIIKNYGVGDASTRAILAGVDMLAICANPVAVREGYESVLQSVRDGVISIDRINESLERIGRVKSRLTDPLPFDRQRIAQLSNEIAAFNERLSS